MPDEQMYMDPTSRGGILEKEGTLDVKYRMKDTVAAAHRLDPELIKVSVICAEAKGKVHASNATGT
jgi:hypothetical protein